MIIRSTCDKCQQEYDLNASNSSEWQLVKDLAEDAAKTRCKCPRFCGGTINLTHQEEKTQALANVVYLTALQLFQALGGMGLPDEIPKSKELVESLLKAHSITHVLIEEARGEVYLHGLTLANGTTIHLGLGNFGPRVYRVERNPKERRNVARNPR